MILFFDQIVHIFKHGPVSNLQSLFEEFCHVFQIRTRNFASGTRVSFRDLYWTERERFMRKHIVLAGKNFSSVSQRLEMKIGYRKFETLTKFGEKRLQKILPES